MNFDELNAIAHGITYSTLRAVIEALPRKGAPEVPGPVVWYDITERVRDAAERKQLELAVRYLTGRGLLHRHRDLPYLVMVLPERKDGSVMPFNLTEARSA